MLDTTEINVGRYVTELLSLLMHNGAPDPDAALTLASGALDTSWTSASRQNATKQIESLQDRTCGDSTILEHVFAVS